MTCANIDTKSTGSQFKYNDTELYNQTDSKGKVDISTITVSDTLENSQLKELIEDKSFTKNYVSARVMLDKQSPYLNSLIVNIGTNKNIKNGAPWPHRPAPASPAPGPDGPCPGHGPPIFDIFIDF